ncbi:MAG: dihydrodipicolinate reductase C-terminal domain-containing protein [Oligoflexia bacterium]|nr:dihydrodipicolinate reductase C-terminal domain-containing protein [Oligoflexia bacterium]
MIRIGLLGATGRMGQCVSKLLASDYAGRVTAGALVGRYKSDSELEPLLSCDAVIDFSLPEAMLPLVRIALSAQEPKLPAFVVGSTGWKPAQLVELEALAARLPVLASSNFSTGVLALRRILEDAAPLLKKLGYEPVLVDTHHRHKKDAPSGTALNLARTIEASGGGLPQVHSIRAGEVIGDHEVSYYGPADKIVLGHFAQDRSIFARGAIDAAIWLASREQPRSARVLTMDDFMSESVLQ